MIEVPIRDMDGYKLLELFGVAMDLPIIMLLAKDDGDIITKGDTDDTNYYLVKPVRGEDLSMMWQYVKRKKKQCRLQKRKVEKNENELWSMDLHSKLVTAFNQMEAVPKKILHHMNVEGLSREKVAKHLQKYRKHLRRGVKSQQGDIGEKEDKYFGPGIEDSGSHIKHPVVWSIDLHMKFVAAINQLGNENVPERILELMMVEGLSREDVASHLQKYNSHLQQMGTSKFISNNAAVSNGVTSPSSENLGQVNELVPKMTDLSLINKENISTGTNILQIGVENLALDSEMRSDEDNQFDIMNSMIKRVKL